MPDKEMNLEKGDAYVLYLSHMAPSQALSIEPIRHAALAAAMSGFRDALAFEDKFTMIIDNYIQYEDALYKFGILSIVRDREEYDDFMEQKRNINLSLSNLMGMCRQYLDQNDKHIAPILNGSGFSLKATKAAEFDANFSYRFMEKLRNYTQHRDFPVQSLSVGARGSQMSPGHRVSVSVDFDIEALRADRDFRKIMNEVDQLPSVPNLTLMVREYVAALARIHMAIRCALEPKVNSWSEEVSNAISEYRDACQPKSVASLAVGKFYAGEPRPNKLFNVFEEPMLRLRRVQKFNYCPTRLHQFYFSSEAI